MNQSRRTRLEKLEDALDPVEAQRAVVLQLAYDAYGDEPPLLGERYVLYLPAKAPSAEAWYNAPARFREPPRVVPEGSDDEVA